MTLGRLLAGAAVAGTAAAGWATLAEPRRCVLRRAELAVLRPPAHGELRVLHVSDLHLWHRHAHIARFLGACAAHEPDVVVLTGDVLGGEIVDEAVGLLAWLAEGRTAIAVLGSNDRYGPTPKNPLRYLRRRREVVTEGPPLDTAGLVAGLTDAGWHLVDNRARRLESPAGPLDVRGVGDAHMGADALDAVSWEPPAADVALALGVTHAPYRRVLDRMAAAGLDLALAGHTHGGQVRVPGVGALVTNCDLPAAQARGVSRHDGMTLHVSAGLGQSRYAPFRFACPPEATLLRLVPASG